MKYFAQGPHLVGQVACADPGLREQPVEAVHGARGLDGLGGDSGGAETLRVTPSFVA